ncbi:hypothetical protein N7474_004692 [Penicillium riverlandense]|uniref:uncharacterized protein n=1 Tax=Penicillium riverlandense TaxID=1903569 RepID=UPI0025467F1D|nr:uncharacterized protein N7474_004692 [Penicillium riverlandense]KAJ5819101.1 hypothetical protein N7474_004692 [Penicillium riverlandense]
MQLRGQQLEILAVSIVLIVVATISIVLRFYSRHVMRAGLWYDDWCSLAALILSYAMNIQQFYREHTAELADPDAAILCFLKGLYAIEPCYIVCMSTIKAAMVLLYWRLFNAKQQMRYALFLAAAMLIIWTFVSLFVGIFQCSPIQRYWNKLIPGHCIDGLLYFRAIAGTNLVTDFYVLVLPLPILWGLVNRPISEKLALTVIFALGTFVSLISIVRIVLLTSPTDPDPMYDSTPGTIWTSVETSIGVLCVNLPAMSPLFRKIFLPRFQTSNIRTSYPTVKKSSGNSSAPRAKTSSSSLRPFNREDPGSSGQQQHVFVTTSFQVMRPDSGAIDLEDWTDPTTRHPQDGSS